MAAQGAAANKTTTKPQQRSARPDSLRAARHSNHDLQLKAVSAPNEISRETMRERRETEDVQKLTNISREGFQGNIRMRAVDKSRVIDLSVVVLQPKDAKAQKAVHIQ